VVTAQLAGGTSPHILAELNDLLTGAVGEDFALLPAPELRGTDGGVGRAHPGSSSTEVDIGGLRLDLLPHGCQDAAKRREAERRSAVQVTNLYLHRPGLTGESGL